MKINVYDNKKNYRLTTEKGQVICIAYKYNKSLKTFFHKDYNEKVSKIEGAAIKSDIAKHPDNYEYVLLVKSDDPKIEPIQTLKRLLSEKVTGKATFVNATKATTPATKTEKAPAKKGKKKQEIMFKEIKHEPVNA